MKARRWAFAPGRLVRSLRWSLEFHWLATRTGRHSYPLRWRSCSYRFTSAHTGFDSGIGPGNYAAICFFFSSNLFCIPLSDCPNRPSASTIQVDDLVSVRNVSHRCLCANIVDAIPLPSERAAQQNMQKM